ncbi:MAG TPA: helix-turn-helix domain-containing protein [Acidimicrobiales bacterium]|nr:helix-turn-helix domain-containing protein [Acidimicrobiales bacterium]
MSDLPPLAQFLRSRREHLSPADAGVKATGRRRTPGLRREEVATLAGVSIDYLIRLEQGRDTNPSPDVLAALADALQLDRDERFHLMGLAARSASPHLEQFCPAAPALDAEVPATVRALLDQLTAPAFVIGPLGDVLASNGAYRTIAGPLGLLDVPNLVRHVFLHPDAPTVYDDWDGTADAQVARLRAAHRRLADDPAVVALLAELLAVPAFAERWDAHPVAQKEHGPKVLHHPGAGELRLSYEALGLARDDQQLIAWLPADDATAAALDHLLATELPVSPAQLRVVGDH